MTFRCDKFLIIKFNQNDKKMGKRGELKQEMIKRKMGNFIRTEKFLFQIHFRFPLDKTKKLIFLFSVFCSLVFFVLQLWRKSLQIQIYRSKNNVWELNSWLDALFIFTWKMQEKIKTKWTIIAIRIHFCLFARKRNKKGLFKSLFHFDVKIVLKLFRFNFTLDLFPFANKWHKKFLCMSNFSTA